MTTRLIVNTGTASEAEVTETARVLLARFNAWRPSVTSRVNATIDANHIHFEFRGESPRAADLVYLATTQGVYRLASSKAPTIIWISDLDFVSTSCRMEDDHLVLDTQVTPAAGAKLLDLTRRNVGGVLETSWDGKVINRATIRGAFGERFQSPIPNDEHFRLMCEILKNGRLPIQIAGYEFDSTSTGLGVR